jgi:rubredoxin
MGSYYIFTCPECGYKAEVSGGKDRGISASVQTMICMDCSIMVDVYKGSYEQGTEPGKDKFIPAPARCPECSGSNLEEWAINGPCPKCVGVMERGEMVALWD